MQEAATSPRLGTGTGISLTLHLPRWMDTALASQGVAVSSGAGILALVTQLRLRPATAGSHPPQAARGEGTFRKASSSACGQPSSQL